MNPYTDARAVLVSAYQAAGLTAYGYTPPTLVPPLVTVTADRPWITPNRIGTLDASIGFEATLYITVIDAPTAVEQLEELVAVALHATPDGFLIDSVDQSSIDGTGSQGEFLTCSIHLTAQVKE